MKDRLRKDAINPKLMGIDKRTGDKFLVGREYGRRLEQEGKIKIIADQDGNNFTGIQDGD